MRLVSVVISTRSFLSTRMRISCSTSSTWRVAGRTSTCGVHQAGRPHQLLHHLTSVVFFPSGRRGRHKHHLAHACLELLKLQWPVVQRAGQAKAVFHQVVLRERSPLYMPPNWPISTWLSSRNISASLGM